MSAGTSRASARLSAAVVTAVLVAAGLSGCSVADVLQKQTSGTAASPRALLLAWRTPASEPDWVPADATDLRYVAATGGPADGSPAVVRVTTSRALPATCTTITRRSLAAFSESWTPKRFPDDVERCGDWAVMRVDGGWFGWTPLAPGEAAEH